MKALVIYDSVFGNTEKIALAVGEGAGAQEELERGGNPGEAGAARGFHQVEGGLGEHEAAAERQASPDAEVGVQKRGAEAVVEG